MSRPARNQARGSSSSRSATDFGKRPVDGRGQVIWLEHDHAHARSPRVGRETAQRRVIGRPQPLRQVDDQQVDLAASNERCGKRPALVRVCRAKHQQPAQIDPACDRLEGIEDAAQIEEGDDPAARLGLGETVQRERRLAARPRPTERGAHAARQPARAEQRIESRETGGDDLVRQRRIGPHMLGRRDLKSERAINLRPGSCGYSNPHRGTPPA